MTNPIQEAGRAHRDGMALNFTNYLACLALAKGDKREAAELFKYRHPQSRAIEAVTKAAISAASTTDTWGAPLSPLNTFADAFINYLRPRTFFGKASGFRPVPMNVKVPRGISGTGATWVGQGRPVPLSQGGLDTVTFKTSKIAGLLVVNDELLESADPDAGALFRNDLADAVANFQDRAFLDATFAAVDDVSPAAITNGATEVVATGNTADAFAADFRSLVAAISTNFLTPWLVMTPKTAVGLASLDLPLTRDVTVDGGYIGGIPVAVTGNAPPDGNSPADGTITLVDTSEVLLSEGPIQFSASQNAIVEMTSTPDSPATAATVFASMFQNNQTAIMVTRYVRWEPRRAGCAAVLTGANYVGG